MSVTYGGSPQETWLETRGFHPWGPLSSPRNVPPAGEAMAKAKGKANAKSCSWDESK